MSMVDQTETERKIAERMDPERMGALVLSTEAGGLGFANLEGAMQFAKFMAISQFAVPKHLRGNPGACLAITIQAVEWKLSPFSVANKSYLVNDRLAYESQLVQAVVLQRAPIVGRFAVEFSGEGDKRTCTVSATLKEDGAKRTPVSYTSPEIGKIPVKNSPLWKNDPDQQLFYYSGRALCRRHFPDVLLGIFTPDELYGPEHARDVTPKTPVPAAYQDQLAAAPDPWSDEQHENVKKDVEGARLKHALEDPTGDQAGELLASQLNERSKRVIGLL